MKRLTIPGALVVTLVATSACDRAPDSTPDGCTASDDAYVCHPSPGCVEHRDRSGQLVDRTCTGGGCSSLESFRGAYYFQGRCVDDAGCTTDFSRPDVIASRACSDDAGCSVLYAADTAVQSLTCQFVEAGAICTSIEAPDGAALATSCQYPEEA